MKILKIIDLSNRGFNEKLNGKYEIRLKGPHAKLSGPYRVNGRILILPIQGIGMSNLTVCEWNFSRFFFLPETFNDNDLSIFAADPDFLVRFNGKAVTRNGKTYLKAENLKLSFSLSKLTFDLTGLYKNDKALGDNTVLFLNENWLEVFTEIKGSVFSAFSQIVESVLNNIFAKIPYEELFEQSP